jgi:hypothetical protein
MIRDPLREDIMTAFVSLIQTRAATSAYPYVTIQRRNVMASQVPELAQPILIVREHDEIIEQKWRGTPAKRTFMIFLILYVKNEDPTVPGSSVINPYIDWIEDLIVPDNVNVETITLNVNNVPLAYSTEMNGTIIKENGDTDENGQCLVIVPIKLISQ